MISLKNFFFTIALLNPLIFALLPALNTFQEKQYFVNFDMTVRYILAALVVSAAVYLLINFYYKDWHKASLTTCVLLLIFYSYSSWDGLFERYPDFVQLVNTDSIIMTVSILLAVIAFFLIRSLKKAVLVNTLLLLLLLFGLLLFSFSFFEGRNNIKKGNEENAAFFSSELDRLGFARDSKKPDIYHIVLDDYPRADILQDYFNSDNEEFITYLKSKGFRVADRGHSNYAQTVLSLSSVLNFDLIQNLAPEFIDTDSDNRDPLIDNRIFVNRVTSLLKQLGYEMVHFRSYTWGTDYFKSDIQFDKPDELNQFERLMVNGSVAKAIMTSGIVGGTAFQAETHADRVLYILRNIPEVGKINGPTFTFAHVMSPHPPFVFGEEGMAMPKQVVSVADGNHHPPNPESYYSREFRYQVKYINEELKKTIESILERSDGNAVIIIHGDHGPASTFAWTDPDIYRRTKENYIERTSVLNAVYLPPGYDSNFYDDMTLANIYPLVFESLFGAEVPKVEDKVFFSEWKKPYQFIDITKEVTE